MRTKILVCAVFAAQIWGAVAAGEFLPLAPFPELSSPRAVMGGEHDHFFANYFGINAWSSDNRFIEGLARYEA